MNNTQERFDGAFSAKDLRRVMGLTYKHLNDWESKGIIPKTRQNDSQWRRFTVHQLLGLMILANLRNQHFVPLDSLKWLSARLFQEDSKILYEAAGRIATHGTPLVLLTDYKDTFIIDTVTEASEHLGRRDFIHEGRTAVHIYYLTPLIRRLVNELQLPFTLEEHGFGYELAEDRKPKNEEEEKILRFIRNHRFYKIEIDLTGGEVKLVSTFESQQVEKMKGEIDTIVARSPFGGVEEISVDGKVVLRKIRNRWKPEALRGDGLSGQREVPESKKKPSK